MIQVYLQITCLNPLVHMTFITTCNERPIVIKVKKLTQTFTNVHVSEIGSGFNCEAFDYGVNDEKTSFQNPRSLVTPGFLS